MDNEIIKNLLAWLRQELPVKHQVLLLIVLVVVTLIIILAEFSTDIHGFACQHFSCGSDKKGFSAAEFFGGILAVIGLFLLYRRTRNLDEQLKLQGEQIKLQGEQLQRQIDKEIDDRFTTAILRLGNAQTSVRTEAVYSLCKLAKSEEGYRQQIVQTLCSHVRSKSQEKNYQEEHPDRPSNDIQTIIDLLFKTTNEVEGVYIQFPELPNADLSRAYLVGANFYGAHCDGVDLSYSRCADANFRHAQFAGANFSHAYCLDANFVKADCLGVKFTYANCICARFDQADCIGADFGEADCLGASFDYGNCTGANFEQASCIGVYFYHADCSGVNFWETDCTGAGFGFGECAGAFCERLFTIYGLDPKRLEVRIGQPTEFDKVIVSRKPDKKVVESIKYATGFMHPGWFVRMQSIIEKNKNSDPVYGVPEGVETEVLQDSEELQTIIKKLKLVRNHDWQALRKLEKEESKKE